MLPDWGAALFNMPTFSSTSDSNIDEGNITLGFSFYEKNKLNYIKHVLFSKLYIFNK